MRKEIIINSSSSQSRVAITEDGNLVDFFVENPEKQRMVGNIYLGKIARVLPGIRAAFIDIGLKHDAFLHFSDIGDRLEALQSVLDDEDDKDIDDEDDDESPQTKPQHKPEHSTTKLHQGQDILIQIIKEPVKDKGVRVSSSLSLPGRFCVLLPFDTKIGVSKKISDYKERKRLRRIAREILPANCGLIIRTAAKDQSEKHLASDLKYLVKTWKTIEDEAKSNKPPKMLYNDVSTTRSVIRDLFTEDVNRVFIDSKKIFKEIRDYVLFIQPELVEKVVYYKESQAIFEAFKIEEQIKQLLGRKVQLPSGGHIVIEHTEAMIVIDVNSGRYAAKKEQELNSLKTDLEAAREIVRQLRLRDIGGLIVVDFIDLEDDKNRKKIYDELRKEFKKDRAKIAMLPMTDFGLMQITRQRVRENIMQSVNEVCPYCLGTGLLTKKSHMIHEIEDWIKKYKNSGNEKKLILKVHPSLGAKLKEGLFSTLFKLQSKYFIKLKLIEDNKMSPQEYQFISAVTEKEITENVK
ncbi:MAG TPA: Rne/Rng family ribonuclease [Ignavibacteria bacterium]|nr:Rne/Rng family ribonuclease [Ignavibacteria bacterium]